MLKHTYIEDNNINVNLKEYLQHKKYLLLFPLLIVLILYLHYTNSLAFSFTDAYNSYARAYFMDKGRTLYAEIFSHHNMLMVYLSYVIQKIFNPQSLFNLVMVHRMSMAVFSIVFASLFIFRFRWVGVGFVAVLEVTKYYLFGNLFLAESLVVYMLAYLVGLAWEKLHKSEITVFDLVITGLFSFLVAFLREPFIPVAALLFLYIFFDKTYIKLKSAIVFFQILLALVLISTVHFEEYFFHLITLNFSGYIQVEMETKGVAGFGILKAFFYPLYIFVSGQNTDFYVILIVLSILFIVMSVMYVREKSVKSLLFLLLILGLSNIRLREPGAVFFNGFHMLPWYGAFLLSLFLFGKELVHHSKFSLIRGGIIISMIVCIGIAFAPPYSVAYRPVNREEEFTINYGRFYVNGEVIKILSDSDDKLFVDDWDTLVFWQSGLNSSYQYAMYFPVMQNVERYTQARENMFTYNKPDFYYTDCTEKSINVPLPPSVLDAYVRLHKGGKPTCLLVLKSKIPEITDEQWKAIEVFGFSKPDIL